MIDQNSADSDREDVGLGDRERVRTVEGFLDAYSAGPDVAGHAMPECAQGQDRQAAPRAGTASWA